MNILDFIQGFIIGSTLIIAIGPQNLFVINQGLKKKFVLVTVLFCSLSDSLLIILGIILSNLLINLDHGIINILKNLGGLWLLYYGFDKIRKVKNAKKIIEEENNKNDLINTIIVVFLITYANPHVYLDTVILIGSISANFESKVFFGLGAIMASFIFFFSLGYLSKYLSKYMHSKIMWYWLDLIIGSLMISYGIYFIFF